MTQTDATVVRRQIVVDVSTACALVWCGLTVLEPTIWPRLLISRASEEPPGRATVRPCCHRKANESVKPTIWARLLMPFGRRKTLPGGG